VLELRWEGDQANQLFFAVPADNLILEVHSHANSGLLLVSDLPNEGQTLSTHVDGPPECESHKMLAVDIGAVPEEGIGESDEEVLGGLGDAELEGLLALLGNGEGAVEAGEVAVEFYHPPPIQLIVLQVR
jgi:hypothetical protein